MNFIKFIRIFLLVLIVIGIILLATQKIWVPKLVDKIIEREKIEISVENKKEENKNTDQAVMILKDGRQCYAYNHEATPEAPYTVNEFIDITISSAEVSGTKVGTQNGPDMTNGYQGTLIGKLEGGTINAVFSYTVEGSQNKEKEIYRAGKTGIEKLRYPLKEEKDMLVPDTTKEFQVLNYARVGCTGSN